MLLEVKLLNKFKYSSIFFVSFFLISSCSLIENKTLRFISSNNHIDCLSIISSFFNLGAIREVNATLLEEKSGLSIKYNSLYYVNEKYIGESEGKAKYPDFKNKKIKYLNEEEKLASRVFFTSKGLFQNGKILTCKECELIVVIDRYGRMYAGVPKTGEFHHSSFFAGHGVASAGVIKIKNGIITAFSNNSGHYGPHQEALFRILDVLLEGNQQLPQIIRFVDKEKKAHDYHIPEIAKRAMAGLHTFRNDRDKLISEGVIRVMFKNNYLKK